jgi:hypothetical protein
MTEPITEPTVDDGLCVYAVPKLVIAVMQR